ncbi:MAG: CoA-binding protein [Acidobacteriaceae bacterium]
MNEPEVIHEILTKAKTIAVVGLSNNPARSSYGVAERMQSLGYRILPVNPAIESVLGEKSYASLKDLPVKPDVVNVFRAPEFVPQIVDEVIELGIPYLWLQLGVVQDEAAAKAEAAGVKVVMDHCIAVERSRLQWQQ